LRHLGDRSPDPTVRLTDVTPHPQLRVERNSAVLTYAVTLAPRTSVSLHWAVEVTDPKTVVAAAPHTPWWPEPSVRADDHRLPQLLYVDSSGSGRANQG